MSERIHQQQRFGGIARLYSEDGLRRLQGARVCVIGVGGVGSWAAEALARSGIGHLALIDLDEVCIGNVNRQLHATDAEIGRPKVAVMRDRIRTINPDCRVEAIEDFLTERNAEEWLDPDRFDAVIDAIDSVPHKALILARCRRRRLRVVTVGGAGGRRDPSLIRIADLGRVHGDTLSKLVRRRLRDDYGFPKGPNSRFRIECVFSPEPPHYPRPDGSVCRVRAASVAEPDRTSGHRLDCRTGFGTATFVTGAFGFAAAARIVDRLTAPLAPHPPSRELTASNPAANPVSTHA